jgi:hypothetical protein
MFVLVFEGALDIEEKGVKLCPVGRVRSKAAMFPGQGVL